MYTPHTVTLYNVRQELDKGTFEEKDVAYITILRGVFLDASKGANVRATGLTSADSATLYIPFSVKAIDGVLRGIEKEYVGAQTFWGADDCSGFWTLSHDGDGGETFFVKGEFVTENISVAKAHDECYVVTKVDMKDYGSEDMRHWEVGGA